jgi:hypothetical protein
VFRPIWFARHRLEGETLWKSSSPNRSGSLVHFWQAHQCQDTISEYFDIGKPEVSAFVAGWERKFAS